MGKCEHRLLLAQTHLEAGVWLGLLRLLRFESGVVQALVCLTNLVLVLKRSAWARILLLLLVLESLLDEGGRLVFSRFWRGWSFL